MNNEEIERRRDIFIRGREYSIERLQDVCIALSSLGRREVVPYEVVQYAIVESGWEETRLYVMTSRYLDTDLYDIRIYLPQERARDRQYGRCWERAVEVLEGYKASLLKNELKVISSDEVSTFLLYPKPPVPREAMIVSEGFGTVDLALRWQRGRLDGKCR